MPSQSPVSRSPKTKQRAFNLSGDGSSSGLDTIEETVSVEGGTPKLAHLESSTATLGMTKRAQSEVVRLSEYITMGNLVSHIEAATKELKTVFHEILEGNGVEPGKDAIYDEVEDPRQCFSVLSMALQQFFDNNHAALEGIEKLAARFQNPTSQAKVIPSTRFESMVVGSASLSCTGGTGSLSGGTTRTEVKSPSNTPESLSFGAANAVKAFSDALEGFKFGATPQEKPFKSGESVPASPEDGDLRDQALWTSYASLAPDAVVTTAETAEVEIQHNQDGTKIINGYEIIGSVGQGAFSKVKLAVRLEDEKNVAIKIMKKSLLRRAHQGGELTAWEQVQSEIAIMKKLRHKNVISLYEVIDDPSSNKLYLIMQYCEHGPVVKLRPDGTCDPLDDVLCKSYLRQLVSGLHYLHRHNVVHRDIKPDNILLGSDDTVYLTDFGVSEMMQSEDEEIVGQQGTPAFFSPELCRGEGGVHGKAVDVWALGITLYCLKFGTLPFMADTAQELLQVIQNESLVFPGDAPKEWVDLLRGMLNKDPRKRFTLPEVRHHEAVTGVSKEEETAAAKGSRSVMSPPGTPGFVRRMRRMTEYDVITINDEDVFNAIAVAPTGATLHYRGGVPVSPSFPGPADDLGGENNDGGGSGKTKDIEMAVPSLPQKPAVQQQGGGHFVKDIRGKVRSTSPEIVPSPPPRPSSNVHERKRPGATVGGSSPADDDDGKFLNLNLTMPTTRQRRADSKKSSDDEIPPILLAPSVPHTERRRTQQFVEPRERK